MLSPMIHRTIHFFQNMSSEHENLPTEDELEENYKAPPQKTIEEILSLDNEDESLRKYKEALLGAQAADKIIIDANNPKDVIVKRLALVVDGRSDMVLELDGDLTQLKKQTFVIKEGIQYKIRIEFFVQREIVHGLKYVQKTSRMGVTVDKMTHMVGSYPPRPEIHSFTTNFEEAPSGMLARGEYSVSSLFTDDDKSEHLKWEWTLKVEKDW
jgi:Rho GDP-dissociation inhibitor